jgi:ribosomal protein L16 Arg81 hydroxylase
LCRQLEADFSCPVQTNIYLTPPNAQGFQTHYDNHDVLVLQVEGRKRWRLYDAPVGTPYRGERFTPGRFAETEPREELVLEPGDVLYVPRGLMHDAVNEGDDQASLHITTGLLAKTWADFLLEAVSEAALRTPALRRALPPGYARGAVQSRPF